jgi:hypothetical protein
MGRAWGKDRGEEECIDDIGGKARKKKRPLGRSRRRSVDNINTDLREIRWSGLSIWLRIGTSGGLL